MDEATTRVLAMLEKLGGVVGESAERLWPAAVRHTYARGITGCAIGFFLLGLVSVIALRTIPSTIRSLRLPPGPANDHDLASGVLIAVSIVTLVVVVASIVIIGAFAPSVMAPEGATLMVLLGR